MIPPTLRLGWNEVCATRVQNLCQGAKNANQGPGDSNIAGNHDFNLNIAESLAVPPRINVIRGPYQSVDDIEDVELDIPQDQAARCNISVFAVQD